MHVNCRVTAEGPLSIAVCVCACVSHLATGEFSDIAHSPLLASSPLLILHFLSFPFPFTPFLYFSTLSFSYSVSLLVSSPPYFPPPLRCFFCPLLLRPAVEYLVSSYWIGCLMLAALRSPPLGLLGNDNKIEISRYLSVYYLAINTSDTVLL